MDSDIKNKNILFIGIGVFLWLAIASFITLFQIMVKDIFLNLYIQPVIIIWTKLFVEITVYVIGFIIGLNLIKSSKRGELTIFIFVILLFFLHKFYNFYSQCFLLM